MRIALKTEGVTRWLAGNPAVSEREHSSVSDFRITPRILTQEDAKIRARATEFQDRGNLATEISFGTVRKFPTVQAAAAYALDYDRTMPRTGTLILETPIPGGGTLLRYMAAVVVQPPGRVITGATVELIYTIKGGEILSAI